MKPPSLPVQLMDGLASTPTSTKRKTTITTIIDLKPPPLPVQLMDGLAPLSKLVQQVLDLVGKVLSKVLSLSTRRGKRNDTYPFISKTR